MRQVAVGIDIGGTNTAMGIVDKAGNVLVKNNLQTPAHGDAVVYVDSVSAAVRQLMLEASLVDPDCQLIGIGMGAPNSNYYTGVIDHAPNLSFKGIVPLVELVKSRFPELETVVLTNDANAAAVGEMVYGGARGMKHFVTYTLGTGVGSGLVVNGAVLYGHDGFAGECGHTTLVPDGRMCGCGGRGHVETYCSASGIKRTAFELLVHSNATQSLLASKSFNDMDARFIYDAAMRGDALAVEVFERTGFWLGMALADTVHYTSPEAIFLFGGPTAAGELLFRPTRESLEKHLLPLFRNKVSVLPSQLHPGHAAILGASALVFAAE